MNTQPDTSQSLLGSQIPETEPPAENPQAIPDPAASPPEAGSTTNPPSDPVEPAPLSLGDITIPEEIVLVNDKGEPTAEAAEFLTLLNEHKIGKDAAQALIAFYPKLLQKAADEYAALWEGTQSEWQAKIQAEAGANLQTDLHNIGKVLDAYPQAAEFRQALAITGAGNHPAFYGFFKWIAGQMNETPPVSGGPTKTQGSVESRMYPTMKQ